MAVYVDRMNARYGRMRMCHMVADTHDELVGMADGIGVDRKWMQKEGSILEHFDICLAKKRLALGLGAVETDMSGLAAVIARKRNSRRRGIGNGHGGILDVEARGR